MAINESTVNGASHPTPPNAPAANSEPIGVQIEPPDAAIPAPDEETDHRRRLDAFVTRDFPYPRERFYGRGIVIPAGGRRYLPCAWVCLNMLRHFGCKLPVEFWHLGPEEMDNNTKLALGALDARAVDARVVQKDHPVRALAGWELKAYALLHSRFAEVLLLDADNVAVVDPTFLFESAPYRDFGAIFWPDFGRLDAERSIWRVTGVPFRDEPEFESGQIVINKARCWKALNVAMHLNEYSDFYYDHIHGDKETFHMAWRKIDQPYAMPRHPIFPLENTMCQHDFDGRRIFQHRNFEKWRIEGHNCRIAGFEFERECFRYLEEFPGTEAWFPACINRWSPLGRSSIELTAAAELLQTSYEYRRVGHDRRPMTFEANGRVGQGAAGCEVFWNLAERGGGLQLDVFSDRERTFALTRDFDGVWKGKWEVFEKMPIELAPTSKS